MKTLIFVLIICSLIQETIWPLDLVLIILICRSMIRTDPSNLYLSFAFGLLISHLSLTTLGITSLVYLISAEGTQILSKSRFSKNPLLIVPVSFVFLLANVIFSQLPVTITFQILPKVILESLLALPVFYLVESWEERFIVRSGIKLKV